jgi:hypothetical protein
VTRELGDDLRYFRAQVLPADLPPSDVKTGPMILDLRYTLAETEAATALDAWLEFRATATTPVFVLVNPDTAPDLRKLLTARASRPGMITIGPTSTDDKPDIAVDATSENERRAYEALTQGTTIESLIAEKADKARIDEASIMRARTEAMENPFEANSLDRITPAEKKTEPAAPPPIDRALQRAVHLHRALRALKRLK